MPDDTKPTLDDDPATKDTLREAPEPKLNPEAIDQLPHPLRAIFTKLGATPSPQAAYLFRVAASFLSEKEAEKNILSSTTLFFALIECGRDEGRADHATYWLSNRVHVKYLTSYRELRDGFFKETVNLLPVDRSDPPTDKKFNVSDNIGVVIERAISLARERSGDPVVDTVDLICALLTTPDTWLANRLQSSTSLPSGPELWAEIEGTFDQWPPMQIVRGGAPDANIVFASSDRSGTPGSLNRFVLSHFGLEDARLRPLASDLKSKGFAVIEEAGVPLIVLVVTVAGASREPLIDLTTNMSKALRALADRVTGRSIWIPLMGTGVGGLVARDSLAGTIGAIRKSGIFDEKPPHSIVVSAMPELNDEEFATLEERFYWAFPPTTEQRSSRLDLEKNFQPDQPAEEDHLGHRPIVDALAAFLRDPKTKAPLTIAIDAPWGTGKSSIMKMLRLSLQPGADKADEVFAKMRTKPLTWKHILRGTSKNEDERSIKTKEARENLAKSSTVRQENSKDPPRVFETVYFNAWRHGSRTQLTARLVIRIIQDVVDRRGGAFWLRLNKNRFDKWMLKRQVLVRLLSSIPMLIGFAALVMFASVAYIFWDTIIAWFGSLGVENQKAVTAATTFTVSAGPIGCLTLLLKTARRLLKTPVLLDVEKYIRVPNYEELAGPDAEVERDFQLLLETLEEDDKIRKRETILVVFIDDLDRCSPTTTVEVVETINVFFGQEVRNCIFVLGMHRELVATSLELAYEKLVAMIAEKPQLQDELPFGRRFLEKIVQFVVHIPEPSNDHIEEYVAHLTGAVRTTKITEAIRMQVRETVVRRTAEGRAFDQDQIDLDIAPMLETLRADPSFRTDLREAFASEIRFHEAQKFDEKGSDALDVFTAVRPALRKNPRQYVRFFNTLRFDNYLDSLSPPIGPPRERLLFLAKRTVLFLEWPELWALVVRQSNSFENLILAVEKGDTEFEEFLEGLYDGIEESKEAPKRRNIRNILNVDERLKELLGAKLPQSAATQ